MRLCQCGPDCEASTNETCARCLKPYRRDTSRNVWLPQRLKAGQLVVYDLKIYKVLAQELQARDSYYFKARYYTTLLHVTK